MTVSASIFARTAAVLALHVAFGGPVLRAQAPAPTPTATAPSAQAEVLFDQGKARLAASDLDGASAAFAESYRLDPATGTLLALAMCHEGRGLLASAWRAYGEVAERAAKEGRKDRERAARDKVASLAPRVSGLTLVPSVPLVGVWVWLDGTEVASEQLGVDIPVLGGEDVIEARRDQEVLWSTRVSVAGSAEHERVLLPRLEAPPPQPAPAPHEVGVERAEASPPRRASHAAPGGLTTGQWAGVITLGAAVVSFGLATGFALSASSQNDASVRGCDGDLCTRKARQQRLDARSAGDVATVAVFSGAALATVGAVLYFAHPRRAQPIDTASKVSFGAWASRTGTGASVQGSF